MSDHNTCLINSIASSYIDVNDRALHYGDGLFETILGADGELYYWSQHYHRLSESAAKLDLYCPEELTLLQDIQQLLSTKLVADRAFSIKIILSRGSGQRGYAYPAGAHTRRIVLFAELADDYSTLLSQRLNSGEVYRCNTRASINPSLAGLKHLNRLENVLARNEWTNAAGKHYIDGLMTDANGCIIECTASNIFFLKDGKLLTPALTSSGVRGVMREQILRLASVRNIDTSEASITYADITSMDEVFISNSLIGMTAVSRLGETSFDDNPVTKQIFNHLVKQSRDHVQRIQQN